MSRKPATSGCDLLAPWLDEGPAEGRAKEGRSPGGAGHVPPLTSQVLKGLGALPSGVLSACCSRASPRDRTRHGAVLRMPPCRREMVPGATTNVSEHQNVRVLDAPQDKKVPVRPSTRRRGWRQEAARRGSGGSRRTFARPAHSGEAAGRRGDSGVRRRQTLRDGRRQKGAKTDGRTGQRGARRPAASPRAWAAGGGGRVSLDLRAHSESDE